MEIYREEWGPNFGICSLVSVIAGCRCSYFLLYVKRAGKELNNFNNKVVDKVNAIAGCRCSYFLLSVKRAGKELNNIKKSMSILKRT